MKSLIANAAALAMAATILPAAPSWSTTFAAWEVAGVPFGDVLNVRKYPASNSQKQGAYPNGTILQMTGKCTGEINLLDIGGLPEWKQRQTVRLLWCQVWHDPARNGDFVGGWVYGKYIAPH